MTHILHVDASARGAESHSRLISNEIVESWLQTHPGDTVTYRDLGHQDIPHVTESFIHAMYTPAPARTPEQTSLLTLSDELIGELKAADLYIFGIPMYNFGVPSVFKAYIDQVVRAGETFSPSNYSGLLENKKMVVVTARGGGGYGPGEAREAYNAQDPSIRSAFGLMGVTDIEFIHLDNLMRGDEVKETSLANARVKIAALTSAGLK